MNKKFTLLFCFAIAALAVNAQKHNLDSTLRVLKFQEDSTLHAKIHNDSVKVKKSFAEKVRFAKLQDSEIYPVINAGIYSGVVPVKDPTEIPDTTQEYKLLFEITASNPDSTASEINTSLIEVARVINLHVASGISLKKIHVVIVMHGGGIRIVTDNATYKEHFKTDNPNIKLVDKLSAVGARFIVCGQSVAYGNIKRETFLPQVKVSLTAQAVLTNYQLKGYVKNTMQNN